MLKTIVVIIPAYNEEKNIFSTYSELISLSKKLDKYKLKIVFINDCSTDNTLGVLKKIKEKNSRASIINLKEHSGTWTGFKIASDNFNSDYLTWLPADMQVPCSIIEQALKKIEGNEKLDCVYGIGYPHGNGIFSVIFWMWLFLRFKGKLMKKQIDFFLIRKNIMDSRRKNEFHNIFPLEVFKSKNYEFIKFRKNPRKSGKSRYNLWSKVEMFTKTVILSVNMNLLASKKPRYEIFR